VHVRYAYARQQYPIHRRRLLTTAVPGSSKRMLEKSATMHADNVTYDLEDSVAPHMKTEARHNLRELLKQPRPAGIRELCVRINSVDTGLALDDLTEVLKADHLDAIMLPKCESAADLHFVTDVMRHVAPARHSVTSSAAARKPVSIIALIESARAVQNLREICAASPYLDGLVFAAEDFAKDMSLTRTPSLTEFLYARSAIATAAVSEGVRVSDMSFAKSSAAKVWASTASSAFTRARSKCATARLAPARTKSTGRRA
jgi:citrate lyase subunit beta-like protein